ncbi:MAG TPA: hypothetical protein VF942_02440, partial [Acidimicrobiales bacterium]
GVGRSVGLGNGRGVPVSVGLGVGVAVSVGLGDGLGDPEDVGPTGPDRWVAVMTARITLPRPFNVACCATWLGCGDGLGVA